MLRGGATTITASRQHRQQANRATQHMYSRKLLLAGRRGAEQSSALTEVWATAPSTLPAAAVDTFLTAQDIETQGLKAPPEA